MSITTSPDTGGTPKGRTSAQMLAGDTVIYLILALLTWGTWRISQLEIFTAGDDTGYWIGVAGAVMMLLLFTYPLRKYFQFTRNWGSMKFWFVLHMLLGVGGPMLILLHSTFRVGSLNAGVALYSMIIVAASGVLGRFFYSRVNRGLHGERTDLQQLQSRAGMDKEDVRSRLAFAPAVEERLKAFEQSELQAKPGWLTDLRRVTWLPLTQWWVYWQCVNDLRGPLTQIDKRDKWSKKDRARRHYKSRQLVRQYVIAVVRVAQFTAYSRLFSLWHVAHIPFVYLLVASAIVHILAVHAY
jgi:hypothetical protein